MIHSFLIVSKNQKMAIEYALDLCKQNQIDKFDITLISFEKAVGIEDVRNFQKQIILKPIKSKTKAVILDSFNGITIESQNALLKLLEEPPNNTIIFITTRNKELLLPTILSRCKIIELKDKPPELPKEEFSRCLNILNSLPSSGIGEKLKLAQDFAKNKEDIIPELEKMIIVTREALIDSACHSERSEESRAKVRSFVNAQAMALDPGPRDDNGKISQYLNILLSLNKTYTVIKTTNVNPRLTLENLFLNI